MANYQEFFKTKEHLNIDGEECVLSASPVNICNDDVMDCKDSTRYIDFSGFIVEDGRLLKDADLKVSDRTNSGRNIYILYKDGKFSGNIEMPIRVYGETVGVAALASSVSLQEFAENSNIQDITELENCIVNHFHDCLREIENALQAEMEVFVIKNKAKHLPEILDRYVTNKSYSNPLLVEEALEKINRIDVSHQNGLIG